MRKFIVFSLLVLNNCKKTNHNQQTQNQQGLSESSEHPLQTSPQSPEAVDKPLSGLSLFALGEGEGFIIVDEKTMKEEESLELAGGILNTGADILTKIGLRNSDEAFKGAFKRGMRSNIKAIMSKDGVVDPSIVAKRVEFGDPPIKNIILTQAPSVDDMRGFSVGKGIGNSDENVANNFSGTELLSMVSPEYEWQKLTVSSGKDKEYEFHPVDDNAAKELQKEMENGKKIIEKRTIVDSKDYRPLPLLALNKGSQAILEAVLSGRQIVVHCKSGKGRSASVVAAYLMKYENYTLEEAIQLLITTSPGTKAIALKQGNHYDALVAFEKSLPKTRPSRANLAAHAPLISH